MDVNLYVKEGEEMKVLKVPTYVIRDLLRDRLGRSDIARIHRMAEKTNPPAMFKAGSVVIDFSNRTAQCFKAGLNLEYLEPTWKVQAQKVTLENY